jgi:hypothetical protein
VFKQKDNRGGKREGSGRPKKHITRRSTIKFGRIARTSVQNNQTGNIGILSNDLHVTVEQENREENINISGNDIVNTTETEESSEASKVRLRTGQPKLVPVLELLEDLFENLEQDGPIKVSPIKEYLAKVLQDVKTQTNKDAEEPTCYKEGTFWIRPLDPIFGNVGKPIEYSLPKVFVWLPHFLLPEKKLKCINCKDTASVNVKEWCFPRRVIDLEEPYYILSKRFKCTACNGTASVFLIHI